MSNDSLSNDSSDESRLLVPQRVRAGTALSPVSLRHAGRLLVALRRRSGLSQSTLAERLGMKQEAITRWESAEYRTVSLERMATVADALDAVIVVQATDTLPQAASLD